MEVLCRGNQPNSQLLPNLALHRTMSHLLDEANWIIYHRRLLADLDAQTGPTIVMEDSVSATAIAKSDSINPPYEAY